MMININLKILSKTEPVTILIISFCFCISVTLIYMVTRGNYLQFWWKVRTQTNWQTEYEYGFSVSFAIQFSLGGEKIAFFPLTDLTLYFSVEIEVYLFPVNSVSSVYLNVGNSFNEILSLLQFSSYFQPFSVINSE